MVIYKYINYLVLKAFNLWLKTSSGEALINQNKETKVDSFLFSIRKTLIEGGDHHEKN